MSHLAFDTPQPASSGRDGWTTSQALGVHDVIQRLCAISGAIGAKAPLRRQDRERCDEELVTAIVELRALITVTTDGLGPTEPQLLESVIGDEIEAQAIGVQTRVSIPQPAWIEPEIGGSSRTSSARRSTTRPSTRARA